MDTWAMGSYNKIILFVMMLPLFTASIAVGGLQIAYGGGLVDCDPGEFEEEEEECEPCPAGFSCAGGTDPPVPCPVGTTSPPGASVCVLSVFLIQDDDDGGDCEDEGIGKWNDKTKTCRLTIDLDGGDRIKMGEDDITLNCNGHLLDGDDTGGAGILLEDIVGVTIRNCHVTEFGIGISLIGSDFNTLQGNNAFLNDDGIFLEDDSNDNTLNGNTANENAFNGIHLDDADFNKLSKNTANGNNRGIFLQDSADNLLSGNTANENLSGILIFISVDNTLNGNSVNGNVAGINLGFADGNTIHGNTANGNVGGISLSNSDDNTLIENTVNENTDGIELFNSDLNDLIGNTAFKNSDNGFFLNSGSDDNTLEDNVAKNNDGFGFEDDTGATAATVDNDYTDNKCVANGVAGSDPTGLCSPQT